MIPTCFLLWFPHSTYLPTPRPLVRLIRLINSVSAILWKQKLPQNLKFLRKAEICCKVCFHSKLLLTKLQSSCPVLLPVGSSEKYCIRKIVCFSTTLAFSKNKWDNPGLFLFIFDLFSLHNFTNTNWQKRRWCAWDLNLGLQDGRCRWNHRAMTAANHSCFSNQFIFAHPAADLCPGETMCEGWSDV